MKIYLVGGAIRDKLLGLKVKDRDWVVVGASPEEMIAKGYRPVGRDFPVFLHPDTQEEYALARTERKSGHGYTGFIFHAAPDVSLEEDLIRRDLTINAMAEDHSGTIIDPYGGQQDLQNKVLRHVSPAFEEDPLRVLRVARFAARLAHAGFTIAPETHLLMEKITHDDELKYLTPERVWQETAKALEEPSPEVYFKTLVECHALKSIMPEWFQLLEAAPAALSALEYAVTTNESSLIRFACLFPPANTINTKQLKTLYKRMRFPSAYVERALLVNEHYAELIAMQKNLNANSLVSLFEKTDAFRRPERFIDALTSSYHLAEASGIKLEQKNKQLINALLEQCRSIDAKPIVAQGYKGKEVGVQLKLKRVKCILQNIE